MTVGLHTVNLANRWLNLFKGTAFTAITPYAELHTADPGAAGTTSTSILSTTRNALTFANAASGSIALASNPTAWTAGAGSNETISHIAVWDAASAGNFMWSAVITTPQLWATGNTFTLTAAGISLTPLAA